MNAGRIFRDDPTTQTTTATLTCDAQTQRMALSRHVADVEGSVRRMLQLDREPDWQAQNTLRERVGNLANAARGPAMSRSRMRALDSPYCRISSSAGASSATHCAPPRAGSPSCRI